MNSEISIKRKLSAIVVTDIAGFTSLSGRDEVFSIEILSKQKNITTPLISKYNGKLQKEMGDGLLLTFDTVTDAIRFSIDFQNEVKNIDNLNLRIGIHEGEISFIKNDIIGDDVNITYRIESFSPEGGVAISGKVQQDISSLTEFKTELIGIPDLKGVSKDVEVHCIVSHGLPKSKQKIKRKSRILTFSIGVFIITFSLVSMVFPVLKNDSTNNENIFSSSELDALNSSVHSKQILDNLITLDSLLAINNLDDNFEAYNLIDQLLIIQANEGDFLSYKGSILHQRYILSGEKKHLEEAISSLKAAIESKNINVDKLTEGLFMLASIEYMSDNTREAYDYSKRAYKINKNYPGLQEIHKKINRKRLS